MAVDSEGRKDLVAISDGYRESTISWKKMLLDLRARGPKEGPELAIEDEYRALQRRCGEAGVTMFRPSRFLRQIEPHAAGTRLTARWQVTSDAIAARLAIVLGADELVLVKSVPPPGPGGHSLDQLAG